MLGCASLKVIEGKQHLKVITGYGSNGELKRPGNNENAKKAVYLTTFGYRLIDPPTGIKQPVALRQKYWRQKKFCYFRGTRIVSAETCCCQTNVNHDTYSYVRVFKKSIIVKTYTCFLLSPTSLKTRKSSKRRSALKSCSCSTQKPLKIPMAWLPKEKMRWRGMAGVALLMLVYLSRFDFKERKFTMLSHQEFSAKIEKL